MSDGSRPVGPFANVLDYGAIGDGIADDSAAIQAAIVASAQKARRTR